MAEQRTPAERGPELSPEQQFLGILAAEDGDTPEPVGDVADDAEVETAEAPEPEEEETVAEAAEDADEGEETDASDEESDEADEEPETPLYTVKVDGVEQQVTLDELRNGYSRQSDYTRKAQQLAQQRKELEQHAEAVRTEREHYHQTLQQLQQQFMAQQEQEPDWDRLYRERPTEAPRIEREWRVRQEQKQRVFQEQQRLALQQQQEQQQQLQRTVEENRKRLPEIIPEWSNPEVAQKERADLRHFLIETGFAEEEVAQIYDARAVALARDAMRYRQQQQKRQEMRPTQKRKGPKTAKPGAAATPAETARKSTRAQRQRLAQTGSVHDAAAVFENMI